MRKIELELRASRGSVRINLAITEGGRFAFHPEFGVRYLPQGGDGRTTPRVNNAQVTPSGISFLLDDPGEIILRLGLETNGAHQVGLHSEISPGGIVNVEIERGGAFTQDGTINSVQHQVLNLLPR